MLETSVTEQLAGGAWPAAITSRTLPNARTLGVFSFVAKTLARSRQHRLILTAFVAIALTIIAESFVGLALNGGLRGSLQSPALRQTVIAVPLALSIFTLSGFRYLFRLPVKFEPTGSSVFTNQVMARNWWRASNAFYTAARLLLSHC